jgi:hypothetical protein
MDGGNPLSDANSGASALKVEIPPTEAELWAVRLVVSTEAISSEAWLFKAEVTPRVRGLALNLCRPAISEETIRGIAGGGLFGEADGSCDERSLGNRS